MNDNFDGNTNVVDYEIIGWHEKDCPEDMLGLADKITKTATRIFPIDQYRNWD